jgi:outer membrane protein assembly factor BamA
VYICGLSSNVNTILHPQKSNTLFLALIILLLCACNPTRKLKEGQNLLNEVKVEVKEDRFEKPEIEPFIRQKPNKKIFGFIRFHLGLYNMVNEEKLKMKEEAFAKKKEEENTIREAAGKKAKKTERLYFGRYLMEVGEAPVIYDSILTDKSSKQINLFLKSKGYFYNTVHDTVTFSRKRASVTYTIIPGKPYRIRKINYELADKELANFVIPDSVNCLIKSGRNYDVDVIQKERDRVTRMINNNGYWGFSKEFIYFKVDSALNSRQLDITIGIKNHAVQVPGHPDSLVEVPHKRYFIGNIFIDTEFDNFSKSQDTKDTLHINNYNILYKNKLKFRSVILLESTFLNKGDIYRIDNSEKTYKRLSELKAFRFVNIQFKPASDSGDTLNCFIQLNPVFKNSFSTEIEGTNTGGNFGISGSITFQNKNTFKGGEVFEVKFSGGVEEQRLLVQQGSSNNNGIPLNTVEFGPELNLYIPKFLVPFRFIESKNSNPKTIFTIATNYQQQPDYTRLINKIAFGYNWNWKNNKKITSQLYPLEVSFIKAELSPIFEQLIDDNSDILIRNAYESHLVTDTRYSFVYNDQVFGKNGSHHFFKFNIESSGNILREAYDISKAQKDTTNGNTIGSYKILGVPFSQYLRADADYRYFKKVAEHQFLVFRGVTGAGITLANLQSLPFEKSFYGGGANDIRAWAIRSLGPGAYNGSSNFDQIGDMQLEANAEYRFKLIKQLNGALFVDAGNVWLLNKQNQNVPQDEFFQINDFYRQIAIGTGIGARLDFNFFIIRLDLGIKVYDPQFEVPGQSTGQCWVIDHWFDALSWKNDYFSAHSSNYSFLNWNLGIGYPF